MLKCAMSVIMHFTKNGVQHLTNNRTDMEIFKNNDGVDCVRCKYQDPIATKGMVTKIPTQHSQAKKAAGVAVQFI